MPVQRESSWHKPLFVARHLLLIAALAVFAKYAVFGNAGYLALRHKQQQYQSALAHLQQSETENQALQHTVTALKSDPDTIEAIAREQLHLMRPGEVVYTYTTRPAAAASAALRTPGAQPQP